MASFAGFGAAGAGASTFSFPAAGTSTTAGAAPTTSFSFGDTTAGGFGTGAGDFGTTAATATPAPATTPAVETFSTAGFGTPAATTAAPTAASTAGSTLGFGAFTAAANTTPATTATTAATTTPALSFGATPAASTSGTAPLSFSGFSTATTSTAIPTTSDSTPAATTFSLGASTPAAASSLSFSTLDSSAAAPSASATASLATPAGTRAPSDDRIRKMTIGEIIDQWNKDLEDHVNSFQEQATEVKKWDERLMNNRTKICKLQQGVQVVRTYQEELEKKLEQVKIDQQQCSAHIQNIEEKYQNAPDEKLDSDSMKRKEAYTLAENIDGELTDLKNSLSDITNKLNASAPQSKAPKNLLTPIIKILNFQMDSLGWIEQKSAELESRLAEASQMVPQQSDRAHF